MFISRSWIFTALFGILGFVLGACLDTLIVMFLNHTLAISGIDYYAGLPLTLVSLIILILIGGMVLGGIFGYRLGKKLQY
ncbi:hypothetical protein ACFLWN_02710 [Chloroflexota bacterium]